MKSNPLIETEIEGLVYLVFGKSRTQKQAVELLYGREYSKVNIQPFVQARKSLVEKGFVEKCDNKLRNAEFKADHEMDLEDLLDTTGFVNREGEKIEIDTAEVLTFVVTKMA